MNFNDMPISGRYEIRGKTEEIQLGDVMTHVVVHSRSAIPSAFYSR